jgi:hypothetical protein
MAASALKTRSAPAPPRPARRAGVLLVVVVSTWAAVAFWNFVKPMPPGTHVTSLPSRLAESQIDFLDGDIQPGVVLRRGVALIDRAEQMIILDQSPLSREFTEHLLARKRQRPNLKMVLVTDPRNEVYGGTSAQTLSSLESAGIIVARTGLDRLRDSNPLYSSLWRLIVGWWSDPFDEIPGTQTFMSKLRRLNDKADQRHLMVADDGAGGWTSILGSSAPVAIEIRGHLSRDMAASELRIAAWSTDDDRLPAPPPVTPPGMGTIDARFLSEGAILSALRDALAAAGGGDAISLIGPALADRQIVRAAMRAALRGAHLQVLLDPRLPANQAVAAELLRASAANVEVRWQAAPGEKPRLVLIRHRADAWLNLGSAAFTRRDLDDLNLEANIELHMPARAATARAAADFFTREWSAGVAYAARADGSSNTYWRYRLAEATGLTIF